MIINVNDEVIVALPHESHSLEVKVDNLKPFDGKKMRVKKKVRVKRLGQNYYELEGAVSEGYEIPFAFIEDWLIKGE